MKSLYPLKFQPILKDKIWGGTQLNKLFGKESDSTLLGESWELSGYPGEESVVSNGFLAGNDLRELIEVYMGELVGDRVFDQHGDSFPLLFKLIDANDTLSIQVHPGDEVAAARHDSFGKTEMWYVLAAQPGAELIIGFREDCDHDTYLDALDNDTVESLLQHVPVTPGDVFFIPAGLIHAIGKGVVLAEIQQSSDVTYRIYDYGRKDDHGNERELHTEEALEVIDFNASVSPKTSYEVVENGITPLVKCEYFTTNLIRFDQPVTRTYGTLDSFVVYMCLEGQFQVEYLGEKTSVAKGETILIPASLEILQLWPEGNVSMLEVFVS